MRYDYLIAGSGLFGSVFAHEAHKAGKNVIIVEKRDHIGGNIYTEEVEGIHVHRYGAHIFHTDDEEVWNYVNQFAVFNDYHHRVKANYKGELYDLPFNMNTFHQMWGIDQPEEARRIIESQKGDIKEARNLEEKCISMVGTDIYEKLVKGYTEKQWGRGCKDLPSFIIERLPLRFEYNNDYFDDRYQGIPVGGYVQIIEGMLKGIEVILNHDFLKHRDEIEYDKLLFTGPIDAFFDYCLGHLEYRSLRFETKVQDHYDGDRVPVMNYTDKETPYTRVIDHGLFEGNDQNRSVITWEYPLEWKTGQEAYYPVNDKKNSRLYQQYRKMAEEYNNVIFGGRLGEYRYCDMDETIRSSLDCWKKVSGGI